MRASAGSYAFRERRRCGADSERLQPIGPQWCPHWLFVVGELVI